MCYDNKRPSVSTEIEAYENIELIETDRITIFFFGHIGFFLFPYRGQSTPL